MARAACCTAPNLRAHKSRRSTTCVIPTTMKMNMNMSTSRNMIMIAPSRSPIATPRRRRPQSRARLLATCCLIPPRASGADGGIKVAMHSLTMAPACRWLIPRQPLGAHRRGAPVRLCRVPSHSLSTRPNLQPPARPPLPSLCECNRICNHWPKTTEG